VASWNVQIERCSRFGVGSGIRPQANIEVVAISSIVKIEILESEDERASQRKGSAKYEKQRWLPKGRYTWYRLVVDLPSF